MRSAAAFFSLSYRALEKGKVCNSANYLSSVTRSHCKPIITVLGSEQLIIMLERITEDGLVALKNLFEFAAYDLSELSRSNINEKGSFISNLNYKEWHEDSNYNLYFIRVDGALAGFAIIKFLSEEEIYYLNHFFVLRKYRRNNIGKQAAIKAFKLYKGKWRVSEFDWNTPAQIFWRKVIKEYTNDQYDEIRRKDNKGPAQEFTS